MLFNRLVVLIFAEAFIDEIEKYPKGRIKAMNVGLHFSTVRIVCVVIDRDMQPVVDETVFNYVY